MVSRIFMLVVKNYFMSGMYVSFAGGIGLVSWHRLVARFDYYHKLSLLNMRRSLRGVQVVMSIIGNKFYQPYCGEFVPGPLGLEKLARIS
jgi:hypothetical protein